MTKHEVKVHPQVGRDEFFAACVTRNGSCLFEAKGSLDEVSQALRTHYREVGQ